MIEWAECWNICSTTAHRWFARIKKSGGAKSTRVGSRVYWNIIAPPKKGSGSSPKSLSIPKSAKAGPATHRPRSCRG